MIPFDLLKCPLSGSHLIEAGAGTGKTHAIAGLYIRLVLERAVPVRELLVVTFTLAATAELKDRIRKKLREALDAFAITDSVHSPFNAYTDPLLQELVQACPDAKSRTDACAQLRKALQDFDEAAVFTIHGFCRRMLQENAFESGAFFDSELLADQRRLKEEIVQDFWRSRFYNALPEIVDYALSQGCRLSAFLDLAAGSAAHPDVRILPDGNPPSLQEIGQCLEAYKSAFLDLKSIWATAENEIREKLQDPSLDARSYGPKAACPADAVAQWLDSEKLPVSLCKGFEKMTPSVLVKATRKNGHPPEHPVFQLCGKLLDRYMALKRLLDAYLLFLKTDLICVLRKELPIRKQERNVLAYEDLLLKLRDALQGPQGDRLAATIRNQFGAALIDEFQDTDPVQYAIFDKVFGCENHPFFLIGDPKQAIYSFRGADVFAYMKAASAGHAAYSLDWNWRSEPALIKAVNTLFSRGGAFVYNEIPFRPARAAEVKDRVELLMDGRKESPLRFWFIPADRFVAGGKTLPTGTAVQIIPPAMAAEISRLIRMGREGRALIGTKPLQEGDLAILVRKNSETRLVQRALQALRIPSVLSSEANVFDTPDALELERVLQAILQTSREDLLRGAMATDMLGARGETLDQWLHDDAGWSARLDAFRSYRDLWETGGFMRMFRTMMAREDVRSRLLSFSDGERRLTNLLHLSEILHQESISGKLALPQLLQWFAKQRNPENRESHEEHLLRLESDADAVKILTIHKSKGLEFPVVFCPFTWGKSRIRKGEPLSFHDETRGREPTLDIGSTTQDLCRPFAEKEQLAENCRLLYVALTRAKHRCYFVWGRMNKAGSSAPVYLFHRGRGTSGDQPEENVVEALERHYAQLSDRDMQEDLERIEKHAEGAIHIEDLSTVQPVSLPSRTDTGKILPWRRFTGKIDYSWRVASYSLLAAGHSPTVELPDRDAAPPFPAADEAIPSVHHPPPRGEENMFTFPGGTRAGILIHEILECLDFTENDPAAIGHLVSERLQMHGFEARWKSALTKMLQRIVRVPLATPAASPSLTLSMIPQAERLNEIEFYYPLKKIKPETLRDCFRKDSLPETGLERLQFNPVRGFMHGFIDLVFRYEGRYYLADWKSNFLGGTAADYGPDALQQAMIDHFYFLQSRLYVLALHQYLTLRLPNYNYDAHFGGIFYLFLRGMDPAYGPASGVYSDRPAKDMLKAMSAMLIDKTRPCSLR